MAVPTRSNATWSRSDHSACPANRRRIALKALDVGRRVARLQREGKPVPIVLSAQRALFDRLVYTKIRHAIGLDHPSLRGELMDFRYLEQLRTPGAGDIRGVVALYGARTGTTVAAAAPGKAPLPVASSITELAISAPAQ